MKKDTLIVIPARYGSTRLPAKVLEKIEGKTIMQWVYDACIKANRGDVIIATDNKKVVAAAKEFGATAKMTSENCQSGTDRVFEVASKTDAQFVVNVQGDEPFIKPSTIKSVVDKLLKDKEADIVTASVPSFDAPEITNPNNVKIVLNAEGRALYFSRSVIPYKRENTPEAMQAPYHLHCGIYGFKREALDKFVKLPKSALEELEKLEQLRALEAGMIIRAIRIKEAGPAIDTMEDLFRAREFAKK